MKSKKLVSLLKSIQQSAPPLGSERITPNILAIIDASVLVVSAAHKDSLERLFMEAVECGVVAPIYDVSLLREYCHVLDDTRFIRAITPLNKHIAISSIIKNGIAVTDRNAVREILLNMDADYFLEVAAADAIDSFVSSYVTPEFALNMSISIAEITEKVRWRAVINNAVEKIQKFCL